MLIGVSWTVEVRFCAVTTISPRVFELSVVAAVCAPADPAKTIAEVASNAARGRWTVIIAPLLFCNLLVTYNQKPSRLSTAGMQPAADRVDRPDFAVSREAG